MSEESTFFNGDTREYEQMIANVTNLVRSGRIVPGDSVDYNLWFEKRGSPQALRAAKRRLEIYGLIVWVRQIGFAVSGHTTTTKNDILNMAAIIEGDVAAMAAVRRSRHQIAELWLIYCKIEASLSLHGPNTIELVDTFRNLNRQMHKLIFASANSRTVDRIEDEILLRSEFAAFSEMSHHCTISTNDNESMLDTFSKTNMRTSNVEHRNILSAIDAKDAESARAFAHEHVTLTTSRMEKS